MTRHDSVHNPYHYTRYAVDVIKITQDMDFLSGNVVKYVTRAPHKDSRVEDLHKARWYLDLLIERAELEEEEDKNWAAINSDIEKDREQEWRMADQPSFDEWFNKPKPTFNQVFFAGQNCDCKQLCEDCDWEIENRERNY